MKKARLEQSLEEIKNPGKSVLTLQKGMEILRKFVLEKEIWGPREIAKETSFSKSSALRILQTFCKEGYLRTLEKDGKYTIGPELWRLGAGLSRKMNLVTISGPIIRKYANEIDESIYLFSWSKDQLIYETVVESSDQLRLNLELGRPMDLCFGAAAKVVLAHLPEERAEERIREMKSVPNINIRVLRKKINEVKKKGFSFTESERNIGAVGFSAPICGKNKTLLGGITLVLPKVRYSQKKHNYFGILVKKCAHEIERIVVSGC